MKAILTKYHGPTDNKAARMTANDTWGNRVSIPVPDCNRDEDAHRIAAEALCKKMKWSGSESLVCGGLKGSMVFVFPFGPFSLKESFRKILKRQESEA